MRRLLALALAFALLGASASAHRAAAPDKPAPDGVSIPSLTHGQMAVLSDNLAAIRALARTRTAFDMTVWRLEDYLNLQAFACLWGVVPGSVGDEDSPFNECAHAYLAAARALLLHLRQTPGVDRKAAEALIGKIEREMLENGASLTLCRYSDQPFNTNEVVWPDWRRLPLHPPSMVLGGALALAIGAAGWGLRPRRDGGTTAPGPIHSRRR